MRLPALFSSVLLSSAMVFAADGGSSMSTTTTTKVSSTKTDVPKGKDAKDAKPMEFPKGITKDDDKTLYVLGLTLGKSLGVFSLSKSELALIERGIADQLKDPAKNNPDMQAYGPKFRELVSTRSQAKSKVYLDKAAAEKGASKTASGLIYTSLKEGTGAAPKPTDKVKVNYKGTLSDGTEFDSSYKRGQPAEFPLNGVIPCWTEGVQKMKVGGKAKLVCPSSIAYGDRGQPPTIPPGAALTFEVELLDASAAPPAPAQPAGGAPGGAAGGQMPPGHP